MTRPICQEWRRRIYAAARAGCRTKSDCGTRPPASARAGWCGRSPVQSRRAGVAMIADRAADAFCLCSGPPSSCHREIYYGQGRKVVTSAQFSSAGPYNVRRRSYWREVSFLKSVVALDVTVRLAAFIIPAGRHRRWRFATNARAAAANPHRGWRTSKICRAEGLHQGHAGNRSSECHSGYYRGDEKFPHFALRLGADRAAWGHLVVQEGQRKRANLQKVAEQTSVQVSRQVFKIAQTVFIGRTHPVTEGNSG